MDSFTFILFGATGDLAGKKIIPALYELYRKQLIPANFILIGNSRTPRTDESFQKLVYQQISKTTQLDQPTWNHFKNRLVFVPGNAAEEKTIHDIIQRIESLQSQGENCDNLMFHIATLPELYQDILANLGHKLSFFKNCGWSKILIEKPFGSNTKTAKQLNEITKHYFEENQIFRIDHFLGKETVQNILAFRFGNGLFKPIWNNEHIDHIQITSMESDGVEGREIFYDSTGVLRDYVQNHLLQILAVVMMDTPKSLKPEDIRQARLKTLKQLTTPDNILDEVVYGQYGIGTIDGQEVRAYTQEDKIPEDSTTPTYVALKALINSPRAKDIPIYIRMGKRLNSKISEVNIQFKDPENVLPEYQTQMTPNILTIRIQPNEGIVLRLDAKKPGLGHTLEPVNMQFCYSTEFSTNPKIEAYQRLIADAFLGDHTLFPTHEEVEAAWQFIDPFLIENTQQTPHIYPAGSEGPTQAKAFIEKDKRTWIQPSPQVCSIPIAKNNN